MISADGYSASNLATVIAAVVTSNTGLATMPGNVFLPATATGLPRDSVVNVTALVTLNKSDLVEHAGAAPLTLLREIDRGLRLHWIVSDRGAPDCSEGVRFVSCLEHMYE